MHSKLRFESLDWIPDAIREERCDYARDELLEEYLKSQAFYFYELNNNNKI